MMQAFSPREANSYSYVGGDPVNLTDSTGSDIRDVWSDVTDWWDSTGEDVVEGVDRLISVPGQLYEAGECGWGLGEGTLDQCDPFEIITGEDVEDAY